MLSEATWLDGNCILFDPSSGTADRWQIMRIVTQFFEILRSNCTKD